MQRIRTLLLAVLIGCASLSPTAFAATQYEGLWYNPNQSGWGLQIAESDTLMFVTIYLYGPTNQPTWYVAQLTWDGTRYAGPLYAGTGPYFAGTWNPALVGAQVVGNATFTPSNAYQGTFTYTVNNVATVSSYVERQYLGTIAVSGVYAGGQTGMLSSCTGALSYATTYTLQVDQQPSGQAVFDFGFNDGLHCTLSGALEQRGRLLRMPSASYVCSRGGVQALSSTATLDEIKATSQGIEGRLSAATSLNGCAENAQFSAARY